MGARTESAAEDFAVRKAWPGEHAMSWEKSGVPNYQGK